jgi:methionine biosynthesis protein MetW
MSLLSGARDRFILGENAFGLRPDLGLVASMIEPESRLLDVGCDDGALLEYLVKQQGCDGRGMEISQTGVNACVARGLPVVQGDADRHLVDYPDDSFDYVILSHTMQAVHHPRDVLGQLLRIADTAIVSILNYGHWRARMSMVTRGRMPHTRTLSTPWFETANIRPCTVRDFLDLTHMLGIRVGRAYGISKGTEVALIKENYEGQANLFSEQAVFELFRPVVPKKRRGKARG